MSKIQLVFPLPKIIEEKEQAQTQAQSTFDINNQGFITPFVAKLAEIPQILLKQHTIAAGLTTNTLNADKMFKAISSIIKVLKAYKLAPSICSLDKISGEIGQIRRLLRIDRLMMLVKEFIGFFRKTKLTKTDKCMMLFKAMIMLEDLSDLLIFLIQLKVVKKEHLSATLRTNLVNIYFFECMGWLAYHVKQYARAKKQEDREKNKMAIVKYILDGLVAHNEVSYKIFSISPKIACLLSLASGLLSLHLVWK